MRESRPPRQRSQVPPGPDTEALADLLDRVRQRRAQATGMTDETTPLPREERTDHGR